VAVKSGNTVTIKTVAEHLGVSHQTVSHVLSGNAKKRGVAEITTLRVQKKAKELGYVPNLWARNLQKTRTGIVSILFDGLRQNWAERVLISAEEVLEKSGYVTMIAVYGRLPMDIKISRDTEQRKIEAILQRRDEGVICQPSPHTKKGYLLLNEQQTPLVFMGSILEDMTGLENISSVTWDCGPAAKAIVRYLAKSGRRRIAFVGGQHGVHSDAIRFEAFKEAMDEVGLPVRPEWVIWDPMTSTWTEEMIRPLFVDPREKPDAIFAINDTFATFILEAARRLGIKVPDDVAITGMGNLTIAAGCGMTTVREPLEEIGQNAAEVMLELLKDPAQAPIHRKISSEEVFVRNTA